MSKSESATDATPETTAAKPRVPHQNGRLVRGLNVFARALDTRFDQADLEHLLAVDGDVLQAARHRVVEAVAAALRHEHSAGAGMKFTHCPSCNLALEAPSRATQLANFRLWQFQRTPVFQWSEFEMLKLSGQMQDGDVLIPMYSRSAYIRKADGTLVVYERRS
jgi:hypothetical protein